MKKRAIWLLVILIFVLSSVSVSVFLKDKVIIKEEMSLKNSVKNTDLSTVLINGQKLGESAWISGSLRMGGIKVNYNEEILTSLSYAKKILGSNYIEGIPILDSTDTITYIDRVNNIELVFKGEENIYLKRIDDNSLRIAAIPILKYRYDPLNVILSISYRFKSTYLFNPYDYITLTLYFTFITFPILLFFIVKERLLRRKILILNISLFIVYALLWLRSIWIGLMSV